MYCKYCGKQIDDDSSFCRFCGKQLSEINIKKEENTPTIVSRTELGGEVQVRVAPLISKPKFPKFKKFISDHSVFFIIFGIWFLINCIFLSCGDDRNGFWPHTYTFRERVAEHTKLEYIPWTNQTVNTKYWDLGPEETKFDWDLKYYGLTEFLIYALLIPIIIFFIYYGILNRHKINFPNIGESEKINPSDYLRKV